MPKAVGTKEMSKTASKKEPSERAKTAQLYREEKFKQLEEYVGSPKASNQRLNSTLGSDPEFFMMRDGTVIPPDPATIDTYRGGIFKYELYPDGAQLELHPDPAGCRAQHIDALRNAISSAYQYATGVYGADIVCDPLVDVDAATLKAFPQSAKIMGCDPDWCSYTLARNRVSLDFGTWPIRYGGGHIHCGLYNLDVNYYPAYIRLMDVVVGTYLTATAYHPEQVKARRTYFGKAGCFRVQPHGVEYRTPDNNWLRHPKQAMVVLGLTRDVFNTVLTKGHEAAAKQMWGLSLVARDIINECDVEQARKLWRSTVAPMLVHITPISRSETCHSGASEAWFADKFLDIYDEHVAPQMARSLKENWQISEFHNYKTAYGDHAHFSRGGFEEFVNPRLSAVLDDIEEGYDGWGVWSNNAKIPSTVSRRPPTNVANVLPF